MAKKAKKTAAKRSAKRPAARAAKTSGRKTAARKTSARKTSARKTTGRRPNAAFMAPVTPSPALAEVVGSKPIPRTEVTKRVWAYIKKNKLQDANNRRVIKADGTLKPVFGGKSSANMFEMTKMVNKHLS